MDLLILAFMGVTQTFDLPPGLLSSICFTESSHRVHAVNADDGGSPSLGVCQVKLSTAQMLGFKGTEKQLMEPKTNIYYGGKYLNRQLDRYGGDIVKAVAAYNSGTYRERKGLPANRSYVTKVFKNWSERK